MKFTSTVSGYIWPEIFNTGEYPKEYNSDSLLADGISGWALCSSGASIPDNFGKGMCLISVELGSATPDFLNELFEKNRKAGKYDL